MAKNVTAWSEEQFESQLRDLDPLYHIHHPFHIAMHNGQLTRNQIQGWVANRFYYQTNIPRKDAAILVNAPDPEFRRMWIQRIIDHDGTDKSPGGIEAWLVLGEAVGLTRSELLTQQHLLPGVRFAVDAYVNFARNAPWQEAVCSSLTELFAPKIHQQRLDTWPENYPWIEQQGLKYFQNRLSQARRDVDHGLALTLEHFNTPQLQQRAIEIVTFKCQVLWSMLDAMTTYYGIGEENDR